jgi:dephospho-CoA kinase
MGKSIVRKMLEQQGAYTIDADGLAHQAMAPGAPAYQPVVETFGKWILDGEGRIERSKLGAVAFSHPEALYRLEAITHPIVGQAIDVLISRARQPIVVLEAIKLLEGQLGKGVDDIWVVDCAAQLQFERLRNKRGMSEYEARKRIDTQNPQHEKLARANVVISNNGTVEDVWVQVEREWNKILAARGIQPVPEQVRKVKTGPLTPPPGMAQPAAAQAQPAQPAQPPAQPRPAAPAPAAPAPAAPPPEPARPAAAQPQPAAPQAQPAAPAPAPASAQPVQPAAAPTLAPAASTPAPAQAAPRPATGTHPAVQPIQPARPPTGTHPAAPTGQPAKPPTGTYPAVPIEQLTGDLEIRRGMPKNAEAIAQLINQITGKALERMDIMTLFGEKSIFWLRWVARWPGWPGSRWIT